MGFVGLVNPEVAKVVPKILPNISPPAPPVLGGIGGVVGVILGELLNPKPVAKTDLASVRSSLGYQPQPAKTVQPEIPQDWFGGQDSTKTYKLSYSRASTYRGTFYGWQDGYTATIPGGIIAPVSQPELWIASLKLETLKHWSSNNQGIPPLYNSETRGYEVYVTMGNGQRVRVFSGSMSGCWVKGFIPTDSNIPDETNPPPKQEAIIENNSAVLAIPPQSVTSDTPTSPPVQQPKEKKVAIPTGTPASAPTSSPTSNPTYNPSPQIEVESAPSPTPAIPAPGTVPGRSTPLPSIAPPRVFDPGKIDNPTTKIRRKVPTVTSSGNLEASDPSFPTVTFKNPEPKRLAVPLPPPTTSLNCDQLIECLGEADLGVGEPGSTLTEEIVLNEPSCSEDEAGNKVVVNTPVPFTVPSDMGQALELLNYQLNELYRYQCEETPAILAPAEAWQIKRAVYPKQSVVKFRSNRVNGKFYYKKITLPHVINENPNFNIDIPAHVSGDYYLRIYFQDNSIFHIYIDSEATANTILNYITPLVEPSQLFSPNRYTIASKQGSGIAVKTWNPVDKTFYSAGDAIKYQSPVWTRKFNQAP